MADFELGDGFNLGNLSDNNISGGSPAGGGGSGGSNPFLGMLIGLAMFIAAFFLISWNEHRAVDAVKALMWAQDQTTPVAATSINPANEGHFIALQGDAAAPQPLYDSLFGIGGANLLRLHRKVEMYQWQQSSHTQNHYTTYSYSPIWSEMQINSSAFRESGHQNPPMPFQSAWQNNATATLGAFRLNDLILGKLNSTMPLPIPSNYQAPAGTRVTAANELYHGNDPATPQIGDMRVTFEALAAGPVSIVGVQNQNFISEGFKPGDRFGVLLAETGLKSSDALYQDEVNQQNLMTWLLRGGALVLMWLGIYLLFSPLVWLANFVPFLDWVVSGFAGMVATIIALPVFLIAEIVFWFSVRPVLSVCIAAAGIAIGAALLTRHKQKLAGNNPVNPTPA